MPTAQAQWFDVDRAGLANLVDDRSKAFVLYELLQNAWDEAALNVSVNIKRVGPGWIYLSVEDDSDEGFKDLTHAYTLFADSGKKSDPGKRGRFNLGEKLVLSLAREACIETTKGTISFNNTGRHETRSKRTRGSLITVELKATQREMNQILDAAKVLIPPDGISTRVNGIELPHRDPVIVFSTVLPTVISDEHSRLRKTERRTVVKVFRVKEGEEATIYEMGIPVVSTGDKYHVDIQQKVPLNMDRDNVTPAYLTAVRVAVLNHTFEDIKPEEATQAWVRDACASEDIDNEAMTSIIHARFGETAVTFDPSDPEANKLSTIAGRQIVHGGSLSAGEWESARRAGVLPPAGQVTPSPRPYSPDGEPLNLIPCADWTPGMWRIARFVKDAGHHLLFAQVCTQITDDPAWPFNATYGPEAPLTFNLGRLGHAFFDGGISEEVIRLVIHELAHHTAGDHLSKEYYDALTVLGAKMTRLALNQPKVFQ